MKITYKIIIIFLLIFSSIHGTELNRFSNKQLVSKSYNAITTEDAKTDNTNIKIEKDKPFGWGLLFGGILAIAAGHYVVADYQQNNRSYTDLEYMAAIILNSSLACYIGFSIGVSIGCKIEGIKCPVLPLYGWGLLSYLGGFLITIATSGYGFPVLYFLPMFAITKTYHHYRDIMPESTNKRIEQKLNANYHQGVYYKINIVRLEF